MRCLTEQKALYTAFSTAVTTTPTQTTVNVNSPSYAAVKREYMESPTTPPMSSGPFKSLRKDTPYRQTKK